MLGQAKASITTIPIFSNASADGDVKASPMYRLINKYARDEELRSVFADVLAGLEAGATSVYKKMAKNILNPSATNRLMQAAHEGAGGATVNIAQEEERIEDAHGNSATARQTKYTAEGASLTHNEQHVTVHITQEQLEARFMESESKMEAKIDARVYAIVQDKIMELEKQYEQRLGNIDAKQQEHEYP